MNLVIMNEKVVYKFNCTVERDFQNFLEVYLSLFFCWGGV